MSVAYEEPERAVRDFNAAQWAIDHDRRDEDRFKQVNDSLTNIWRVLGFVGMTFVALTGWSLKNQYDQLQALHTVSGQVTTVSGQVATVQATAVPKPPQ